MNAFYYQGLYNMEIQYIHMSKNNSLMANNETNNIYETINQSVTRVVDEAAKAQPQYLQSISNLQLDYIQAVKSAVQNTLTAQKNLADASDLSSNIPSTDQYGEQLRNQINEITNNIVRAVQTNNQVVVNSLDAARDNIRIYARISDAVLEFNSNIAKAWTSYFSAPQQQFFRPLH
jgi:hypothetical protein